MVPYVARSAVAAGPDHNLTDYMKHSNDKVVKVLKDQIKKDKEYNEQFLAARRVVVKREAERLSHYERFKRDQSKVSKANDILINFLSPKKDS